MTRTSAAFALAALVGAGTLWAVEEEKAAKTVEVRDLMNKINGKGGFAVVANNELKAEVPDWDKITSAAKEITPLADAIARTNNNAAIDKSKKWVKMSKAYAEAAKEFEQAAGAKDLPAAKKAFVGLTQCVACHREFSNYSPAKLPEN